MLAGACVRWSSSRAASACAACWRGTIRTTRWKKHRSPARRVGQDGAAPAAEAGLAGEIAAFQAAQRAGRLARAVGRANSLNPVSIIVPCHRVIGANGRLTGYAGGLARKQWLLVHERAVRDAATPRLEGY
ncbi:MAG: Methylated-DNA--protein-cysteine methyltransferase [Paracidovorax wautersii]|uniref:Methylated-DNA--protein-cysteine methyltransferase n=1 Tax=Paracidovorax wautersii TaxID=1177982 RepID=A0A7V8JP43_9BURK|nr:MAG: Methylated-DNA--protein-cysteine methyltransferase [Paracidovorax wautersii]